MLVRGRIHVAILMRDVTLGYVDVFQDTLLSMAFVVRYFLEKKYGETFELAFADITTGSS